MPATVFVQLDRRAIQDLLQGSQGPVALDLLRRGNRVLNRARRDCPADTGRLRGSLTAQLGRIGNTPAVRVGSNLPYAVFVHEGTGVHAGKGRIYPKTAKALRWPATNKSGKGARRYRGGKTAKWIYAKSIRGMKGTPFLLNALSEAGD